MGTDNVCLSGSRGAGMLGFADMMHFWQQQCIRVHPEMQSTVLLDMQFRVRATPKILVLKIVFYKFGGALTLDRISQ